MEFSGCEAAVSDKTIMLMHDRRNAVELKYFMPENSAVTSKPMNKITRNSGAEIVTLEDFDWANPVSMRQVQEAIENYRSVLHLLWPMEVTGDLVGRLLLRYWWIAASNVPKVKVAVVVAYFNKIQRLNAKRASNKTAPLSFEEHEKYIKEALAAHGLSSEVPYDGFLAKDHYQGGASNILGEY